MTAKSVQLPGQPSPPAEGAAPGGSALLPLGWARGRSRWDCAAELRVVERLALPGGGSATLSPQTASQFSPEGVQTRTALRFSPPRRGGLACRAAGAGLGSSKDLIGVERRRGVSPLRRSRLRRDLRAGRVQLHDAPSPPALFLFFTGAVGVGMPRRSAAPGGDQRSGCECRLCPDSLRLQPPRPASSLLLFQGSSLARHPRPSLPLALRSSVPRPLCCSTALLCSAWFSMAGVFFLSSHGHRLS